MRIFLALLTAIVTGLLVYFLDMQLPVNGGKTPRLGMFLSPQKGFWQNAEKDNEAFQVDLKSAQLNGKTEVYFDERLVPHVYADDENDAYFVQGFLHAKFRLWQMELQTYSAAGRLCEIFGANSNGKDFLAIDKYFRRLGMVYAAENSLKKIEEDPLTKKACDAYTAGVNTYIAALKPEQYPLEYKLLNYAPEPWTNLKSALFLKLMSYDLAGYEQDFEYTNARAVLTKDQFELLYPYGQADNILRPIVANDSTSKKYWPKVKIPAGADSVYFKYKIAINDSALKPDPSNGSNNWAVGGSKTKSGSPILCNDPHLQLSLPSLWYEIQISTPTYNVYGASFPGAPGVIIGFNDSSAFGFTNAMRDVRDYYNIKFKDATMAEYWFDSAWKKTTFREEKINIKGSEAVVQKVPYTVFGPVLYNQDFPNTKDSSNSYACHWQAYEPSNEIKAFLLLDRAKDSADYIDALKEYKCPGQNMLFATKSNKIMLKQQGVFPAKWYRQGDFVMPGEDSSYMWQFNTPQYANLLLCNPASGYVSSANQLPYDTTYPYYLGGSYPPFRGLQIDNMLKGMNNITVQDMQGMQTDNYNIFAEMIRPAFKEYLDESILNPKEKEYLQIVNNWNLRDDAKEKGPSVFDAWYDNFKSMVYDDELADFGRAMPHINESTLLEAILNKPEYEFVDDKHTDEKETWKDIVTLSFKKAVAELEKTAKGDGLLWSKYKDSGVPHLLSIPGLSRLHLEAGGGNFSINCYKKYHGPSWRMIVQLSADTEAYGIYPGGQSGNPGSKYYDMFVDSWVAGKYYKLQILAKGFFTAQPNHFKMTFSKA